MTEHDVLVRRAQRMAVLNDEMAPEDRQQVTLITMGAFTEAERVRLLRNLLESYRLTEDEIEAIERGERIRV